MKLNSKPYILTFCLWIGYLTPSLAAAPADLKTLHLLNRLSFGARLGDLQKVQQMGVEAYLQQQLQPQTVAENPQLEQQLARFKTLQLSPAERFQQYNPRRLINGAKTSPEMRQQARQKLRGLMDEAVQARLMRAVESDRQLQEVMVDFWFNHFNVFAGKGLTRLWVGSYEQTAIRPHALGRFRDLLGATAKHPAMLFYLDNWQNTAPQSAGARGRFKGLNENYARELMELHTVGVDSGYTQQDVITLAKIFTGWGLGRTQQTGRGFLFDASRHDNREKVFLGRTIKSSGMAEGEQALDLLAKHPATAQRISYKLAQYFVADQPPKALVDRLAQRFQQTDGDIRAVLDTLFHSPEFWDRKYYNAKFKTPYQYVVSAVRATDVKLPSLRPLQGALQQLGMPVYGCPTPDGYKNTQAAWLSPDGMTRRISFATALGSGRLPNVGLGRRNPNQAMSLPMATAVPPALARAANADQLTETLGNPFSAKTQQAIANSDPNLRAALILASPEFMTK